jgi:hypothetical protein
MASGEGAEVHDHTGFRKRTHGDRNSAKFQAATALAEASMADSMADGAAAAPPSCAPVMTSNVVADDVRRRSSNGGWLWFHCARGRPDPALATPLERTIDATLKKDFHRSLYVAVPDGNCMFRTLSTFTGLPHELLRAATAAWLIIHAQDPVPGVDAGTRMTWMSYVAAWRMRQPTTKRPLSSSEVRFSCCIVVLVIHV